MARKRQTHPVSGVPVKQGALPGDANWWTGFRQLEHNMAVSETALQVMEKIGDKLLEGPMFFKGPDEECKEVVQKNRPVVLMGKERVLDASLAQATMRVSYMLGLNELQSYCLLKQFAKQAQLDAVQLANISEDQLLEIQALYIKERRALFCCILGVAKLRYRCQDIEDENLKKIKSIWDDLHAKGWAKNLLNGLVRIANSNKEAPGSKPATLGAPELDVLIEILRIYYEIQHPCEDGIINLIQTLNVLTSSSAFAEIPWELNTKVWHLFMTALDFSALLKCVNSSEAPPHRLIGSLKKIDAEMQELTKCRNDSVGAVIVAWALFVGVEKRISSTTSAKGSPGGKSSVDPNTYFAMMNQEYVFFVLEAMSTAAANLQEKCAIERNILVSMSAIVLVAQNLLSSQDALYRTMDIVVPILEGDAVHVEHVLHLWQYGGIQMLYNSFRSWFPALPNLYLRMLAALCSERRTRDDVSIFKLKFITLEHEKSDLRVHRVRGQLVEALRDVNHGNCMQIPESSQGRIVPCPFAMPNTHFVQWECPCNALYVMNVRMGQIMSAVNSQKATVSEKVEAIDMLAMLQRLLDSPHWVQIIEDSIPDSKDDVKSYHHEWINFAHSGLDWFASLGEFVPVANCLSILKSYATLLPASVCAVVARSSFLINTQEAENDHPIYKELEAVGSKCEHLQVVSEFVKLVEMLVIQGMVGDHIKAHVDMIVQILPLKLKLWNSNLSVYGELTRTVLFLIGRIVSTSWCRQNGLVKRVLHYIVHSQEQWGLKFTGTLQLLLDGTLLHCSDFLLGDQIDWKSVWVAKAQLGLINKLLSLSEPTKTAVVEALLGAPKGFGISRCATLVSCIYLPEGNLAPGSEQVYHIKHLKELGIIFLSKILKVTALLGKPVGLGFLVPSVNDTPDSSVLMDMRRELCMVCQLENAKKQPKMFKSSVDLLAQAAQHQHQLLDVLLAPQHSDAQAEPDILSGLLDIVCESRNLVHSHPGILFDCVRGIHALWLQREARPGPVTTLTVQNKFWSSLVHILQDTTTIDMNGFHSATGAYVLQILVMESKDGWSGQSRTEAKNLWTESKGEALWTTLQKAYASCDCMSSAAGSLLAAANEVAFDILLFDEEQAPHVDIRLVEMLRKVVEADIYGLHSQDRGVKLRRLRAKVADDIHQQGGQVLLSALDDEHQIWGSEFDSWIAPSLSKENLSFTIPSTLTSNCHMFPTLIQLLNEARWLAAKMRSKVAAIQALNQLASCHWTEQSASPIPPTAQAAVVESCCRLITPWVEVAKGFDSFKSPGVFSSPLPAAQKKDIKLFGLKLAHSLAMGLQFFSREWCSNDLHKKSGTLRRVQSPTPRRTSLTGTLMHHEGSSEDLPFKDVLLGIFKTIDAVFDSSSDGQLTLWMAQPHSLIGVMLSTLVTVLFEYPFHTTRDSLKYVPREVQTILTSRIVESLCWLISKDGTPNECLVDSLVCLGVLQQFDIWDDRSIHLLREHLDVPGLISRAKKAIPEFAQKKGKGAPRVHWSSAVLGLLHFMAKPSSMSSFLLTPDTLVALVEYGKCLLEPEIGGLGTPVAAPKGSARYASAHNAQSDGEMNFQGAYDPENYFWRVEHEQWLLFIGIIESILYNTKVLCDAPPNFQAQLLSEFQPALIKALEFPAASYHEPLTVAQLLEAISMLRFAIAIKKYCCPISLRLLRQTVAKFVDNCAHRLQSASVMYCFPISDEEVASSLEMSPIACHYGWFRKLAADQNIGIILSQKKGKDDCAGNESHHVRFQVSSSGGAPGPLDVQQTPRHLVMHRNESAPYTNLDSGILPDQEKGTKHSFSLGESMYNCLNFCLSFLLSAAPIVTSGEVQNLRSGWPSKPALLCVRQDCLELTKNISHWEMEDKRVLQVVLGLRDIIQMSTELLGILGHIPQSRETERIESTLQDVDRYLGSDHKSR